MGWFVEVDEPFSGEKALGRESYLKSRFYNEIIAPSGYYDAALTVLAKSVNRFGSLSVPSENPVDEAMLQRLRDITPHVRRAVEHRRPARRPLAAERHAVGRVRSPHRRHCADGLQGAHRPCQQFGAEVSRPAQRHPPRRRFSVLPRSAHRDGIVAGDPACVQRLGRRLSALRHRAADHDQRRHRSRRLGAAARRRPAQPARDVVCGVRRRVPAPARRRLAVSGRAVRQALRHLAGGVPRADDAHPRHDGAGSRRLRSGSPVPPRRRICKSCFSAPAPSARPT